MKALIRVQAKYRPISGDVQGYRIQACIPNLAARRMLRRGDKFIATEEEVPSFRKPYLIAESMDYPAAESITEGDMARFKKQLQWEGFKDFEFIMSDRAAKEKVAVPAHIQDKIDALLKAMGLQAAEQARSF